MEQLDLHGCTLLESSIKSEDFILKYWNEFPVRIITGYSTKMKENVIQILNDYDCTWETPSHNGGEIIVLSN